jgi:hypothetical protein
LLIPQITKYQLKNRLADKPVFLRVFADLSAQSLCKNPHLRFPESRTFCRRAADCCAECRIWIKKRAWAGIWQPTKYLLPVTERFTGKSASIPAQAICQ